jgi:type VI secretion system secreted protein VgrG
VVIGFFGDDADQPVCTGMLYNQSNLPPWALPGQSALSGFRSRELTPQGGNSAAGRSNHVLLDDTEQQIQAQLKSDHQSSSLSLGHITRIEDNAGRKDARGEGLELRTDGHGVLRAAAGMLLTTEGRANAAGHAKAMGETVQRLTAGRDQHEALSDAAQQAEAHSHGDQDEVARALKRQNDAIQGRGSNDPFPELAEPHLVLASPAGIATTTAGSTHIASNEHTAFTSGGHTSISAGRSLLVSVKEAIRMCAQKAGIKLIAAGLNIEFTAVQRSIHLLAKLDITAAGRAAICQALLRGGCDRANGGQGGAPTRAAGLPPGACTLAAAALR